MKSLFTFIILLITNILLGQTRPDFEWVEIPASEFIMGSPKNERMRHKDEKQHKVSIENVFISSWYPETDTSSGLKISMYEVTFRQFDFFCENTGKPKPSDNGWGRGNRPVINVTWKDASDFAGWMGCRLPTEAEWELMCRAGTLSMFNTGDTLTFDYANVKTCYPVKSKHQGLFVQQTREVGSYSPNKWGLYDMHGNVWEWCSDWYTVYDRNKQRNPAGPSTGTQKVIRGGAWNSNAVLCRSATRTKMNPKTRKANIGFRIVSVK